jgi:hypothetical protein
MTASTNFLSVWSKQELETRLNIIREFKEHEGLEIWEDISFIEWKKLEQ